MSDAAPPHGRTGRSTQEDPIGLAGGLNLYGYANTDPINFADPFGLCGIAGAVASVAMGAVIGAATGGYSVASAVIDAGTGAGCGGVVSKVGKLGKAARLLANRVAGRAAEAKVAAELVEEGGTILGSQVAVKTKEGRRVVDHLVQQADGSIVAVEVKSGGAVRSAGQRAKDAAMAEEGTIVGRNAPDALRGETMPIKTVERRVPE